MTTALSPRRLQWLMRARGPDLSGWPAAERVAALDLLRQSPEARVAFADFLAHDEEGPERDGDVLQRMQTALRRKLAPLSLVWRGVCVVALVACVVSGLYLSVEQVEPDASTDLFGTAQLVSFAALDQ